jgi:predicted DNA-binding transcriptional regulator AlpA
MTPAIQIDDEPCLLTDTDVARMLGVDRTPAYRLVRDGEWPTPVLRAVRPIRIPSGPIWG